MLKVLLAFQSQGWVNARTMESKLGQNIKHLKGALGAVAERMRLQASKEDGVVDVDLRLLPRPEKSDAVGSMGPFLL